MNSCFFVYYIYVPASMIKMASFEFIFLWFQKYPSSIETFKNTMARNYLFAMIYKLNFSHKSVLLYRQMYSTSYVIFQLLCFFSLKYMWSCYLNSKLKQIENGFKRTIWSSLIKRNHLNSVTFVLTKEKIVTTLLMAVKLTLLKETWVDLPFRVRGYTDHNILYIIYWLTSFYVKYRNLYLLKITLTIQNFNHGSYIANA